MESEKAGDLRVLREVFRGFSEEARTRGLPSPSFGGFGLIGVASDLKYSSWKAIRQPITNVRFGLRFQPVDATLALILSAGVSIPPVRDQLVINRR